MAQLGIILLLHSSFERAGQTVRLWRDAGCPVVVHIDKAAPKGPAKAFQDQFQSDQLISFAPRFKTAWGGWGLVKASQAAAALLLRRSPELGHILLTSQSCLMLRPPEELIAFLKKNTHTDFIESVWIDKIPWQSGGFEQERFYWYYPFNWNSQRHLFDAAVAFQKACKMRRKAPPDLRLHLGSQWWCLTSTTLRAILETPKRKGYERFFKSVWIPDESYFQTLARLYSDNLKSQSLTYSKFDHHGKPFVFYDDHLQLLQRSNHFLARKIWAKADALYSAFPKRSLSPDNPPSSFALDSIFNRAKTIAKIGRPGLVMQSSVPAPNPRPEKTAAPYAVLHGFSSPFDGFNPWLQAASNATVHGHLFAKDKVYFENNTAVYKGGLIASAPLRDRDPEAFLRNLIWNTQGRFQCLNFGMQDRPEILPFLVSDKQAIKLIITGAWLIELAQLSAPFEVIQDLAASWHQSELDLTAALRQPAARGVIQIWTLAEVLKAPETCLGRVLHHLPKGQQGVAFCTLRQDLSALTALYSRLHDSGIPLSLPGNLGSRRVFAAQKKHTGPVKPRER